MNSIRVQKRKPNIVLIVLDSVRKDHLSCYGYTRETTPNIDRIADEGVQYMRAYATSCWTLPSHASLFTGFYPSQHQVDLHAKLAPEHLTLADYLSGHGYQTACISCNGLVSETTGLARGFDLTVDVEKGRGGPNSLQARFIRSLHRRWRKLTQRDRGADKATSVGMYWLERRDTSKPFFLFVNYMDCHGPYKLRLPARYRFVAPADRGRVDGVSQDRFGYMAGAVSLSDQDLADLQALYDGCLSYLDAQIGALDDYLGKLGVRDETIFIITSDHGESFGEHGLLDHQYGLYEHLIQVPLIIRFPDGAVGGRQDQRLVQHVDLFPTLTGILGDFGVPSYLEHRPGRRMLEESGRDSAVAEYLLPNLRQFHRRFPEADTSRYDVALRSLLVGDHKLIWRSDGGRELYDLASDPDETTNLADRQAELADQLVARLEALVGPWPDTARAGQAPDEDDELRKRLEALGYL